MGLCVLGVEEPRAELGCRDSFVSLRSGDLLPGFIILNVECPRLFKRKIFFIVDSVGFFHLRCSMRQ